MQNPNERELQLTQVQNGIVHFFSFFSINMLGIERCKIIHFGNDHKKWIDRVICHTVS